MANRLWDTLMRFHREIVLPDIDGVVAARTKPFSEDLTSFKRETQANFDALWSSFGRLESEYQAIIAAVKRIEEQHQSEN